ncbi:MAG: dihydroorotase [Lachnospiraceae bacterium]|nr:dihydroorotase [Lachnospiraceae bacterium]
MLIRKARVIDPGNNIDKICDLRTAEGAVAEIGEGLDTADPMEEVIDAKGLVAAPGLVDVHAHFRDPGQTAKETLHTGALAAAAGGYTSVICMANTVPAVDSVETLEDITKRAEAEQIHIYQTAAVTVGRNGAELVDMEALRRAGAAGFTDDGTPVMDETLIREAMRRAAVLDSVISLHEEDPAYVWQAGVNSGRISDAMGLRGADRKAEYSMVERDLFFASDIGAKIDIQHVSARESVEAIRKYKADDPYGRIHAEATPHHFSLTEDAVMSWGTLAKVNPPLRTEADRQAVIEGIKDGTLDLIATDHAPHTREEKAQDFTKAPSGMTGLETALALGITNLVDAGHIDLTKLIQLMSTNPARLYGLEAGELSPGFPADIVIFDPGGSWTVRAEDFRSRSVNSPFVGAELKGRVRYTVCSGKIVYQA